MLQDIRGSISEKGHILKVMERGFKGIWIPKEIWLNENLSPLDKIVLAEIDSLDSGKGCYASNEYLADFCKCTERTIQNSLKTLKDESLVEIQSFDGRKRVIRSNVKISWQSGNPFVADTKNFRGRDENFSADNMYSNIDINIDNNISPLSPLKKKSEKKKYGQYENVKLTDEEYKRLVDEFPNAVEAIKWFDEYIEEKGDKWKSHNLAMRRWVFAAIKQQEQRDAKLDIRTYQNDDMEGWGK